MNLREIIEAFQNVLIRVCLWGLAALAACYLVAWLCRSGQRAVVWWRSLRAWLDKIVFISLFTACILIGGTKLNNPPLPQTPLPQSVIQTVTDDEIVQGYRLESVTTNDAVSYAMPTNGVAYAPWSLRGGRETHFPLDLGDFAFPFGTGVVHRLDVLSGGMVESLPRPSYMAICAGQECASLIPGESGFWWADAARSASAPYQGTVRAKLLTWEDVYANRDRTGPYSAQIELREDGGFTTRSNNVESVYRRVLPFDWDDDGLENSVDPDPHVAGPDAHGTNAEWYNTVCSNVLEATAATSAALPPELTWREDVNSNAYYFVDVVTETGPAPIYFAGDRESRLGNPVVVALAGVTNHVPLLIGIDYAVTSTVPFTVSYPMEYMYLDVETNESCHAHIRWPLNFVFTESIGASNRVYTVTVEPYDPGGVLEWTGSGGGVPMRGATPSEGCDCIHYGLDSVWFTCSSTCTCSMGCTAEGCYHLEDASFLLVGGQCRCGFDDPPSDDSPSPHEPDDPPSLTISFSKQAVIFEDAYENSPGETVPRRSTRVRLTIDAYGGTQGGALLITAANMGKLASVSGGVSLPYSQTLVAGESYHATCVYEGLGASDSENDVSVNGTFTELSTAQELHASNALTVVRLELEPYSMICECRYRHRLGVMERAKFSWTPSSAPLDCTARSGRIDDQGDKGFYYAPLTNMPPHFLSRCRGAEYPVSLEVVEPETVVARSAVAFDFGVPENVAGGAGMELELVILPTNVTFKGISAMEVPSDYSDPQGYFTNTYFDVVWSHTTNMHAGIWHKVRVDNIFMYDRATMGDVLPRMTPTGEITQDLRYAWISGSMNWYIPVGWNEQDLANAIGPVKVFTNYWQRFRMSATGTLEVEKLGYTVERATNSVIRINDVIQRYLKPWEDYDE